MLPAEVLVDTSLGKGLVRVPVVIHSKRPCEVLQDGHGLEDGPAVVLDGRKGEERIDLEKFWEKIRRLIF